MLRFDNEITFLSNLKSNLSLIYLKTLFFFILCLTKFNLTIFYCIKKFFRIHVFIKTYIFSWTYTLKGLSDASVVSLTKNKYGLSVHFL